MMKYIKESKWVESKRELKYFQDKLDLDVTIDELMHSIDATQLDLKSIYPTLTGKEKLLDLPNNEQFNDVLRELKLKLSEYEDTDTFETFSRIPLRWYWIYTEDANELEIPVQIMYKYHYNGKWSDIKLYMVNKEITNFYNVLSLVTIELKVDDKRWFYTTSDSGKNWTLQKDKKQINIDGESIIVQSNKATSTFKETMRWEEVLNLAHNKKTKLIVY